MTTDLAGVQVAASHLIANDGYSISSTTARSALLVARYAQSAATREAELVQALAGLLMDWNGALGDPVLMRAYRALKRVAAAEVRTDESDAP